MKNHTVFNGYFVHYGCFVHFSCPNFSDTAFPLLQKELHSFMLLLRNLKYTKFQSNWGYFEVVKNRTRRGQFERSLNWHLRVLWWPQSCTSTDDFSQFSQAFLEAQEKSNADIQYGSFDLSVMEIDQKDLRTFLDALYEYWYVKSFPLTWWHSKSVFLSSCPQAYLFLSLSRL